LDRPLDERNTIEMQSITALAHLRAVVLYIVDISEQCGFTIAQQAALFHSIKPLFANKPLVVAINKIDVRALEDLSAEDRALIDGMKEAMRGPAAMQLGEDDALPLMSTLSETGVMDVKNKCCDLLLAHRVEQKLASRRAGEVMNRLHVAMPVPRDSKQRPAFVPPTLEASRAKKAAGEKVVTEKDLQEQNGGAGVYSADLRKRYMLEDDDWKYDILPEIYNGKNIADFIDPEIEAKLAELEREEEELEAQWEAGRMDRAPQEEDLDEDEKMLLGEVRTRRNKLVAEHRRKKAAGNNNPVVPRKVDADRKLNTKNMKASLESMGLDATAAVERARSRSRVAKRGRSLAGDVNMDADGDADDKKKMRTSKSRSKSVAKRVKDSDAAGGFKSIDAKMRATKMADKAQRKMNKMAKAGEGDRSIQTKMPKHLFSGKRGIGKTDRR